MRYLRRFFRVFLPLALQTKGEHSQLHSFLCTNKAVLSIRVLLKTRCERSPCMDNSVYDTTRFFNSEEEESRFCSVGKKLHYYSLANPKRFLSCLLWTTLKKYPVLSLVFCYIYEMVRGRGDSNRCMHEHDSSSLLCCEISSALSWKVRCVPTVELST